MIILDIILGNNPLIGHLFLGQKIYGIGLLQKGISHVFLIGQHLIDHGCLPHGISGYRLNPL